MPTTKRYVHDDSVQNVSDDSVQLFGINWRTWVSEATVLESKLAHDLIERPNQSSQEVREKKEMIEGCRNLMGYLGQIARILSEFARVSEADGAAREKMPRQIAQRVATHLDISTQALYKWLSGMGLDVRHFFEALHRSETPLEAIGEVALRSQRFKSTLVSLVKGITTYSTL